MALCQCRVLARRSRTKGVSSKKKRISSGGSLLTPALGGGRQIRLAQWRNLAGKRHPGDAISIVVPDSITSREIVGLLHPVLEHGGQPSHLFGVAGFISHVPELPGIRLQVVQLESRPGNLEKPALRRGEPAGFRSSPQRQERRTRPDVGGGAE